MRWICKDDIELCLTEEWRKSAAAALEKLENAQNTAERKKKLKSASSNKIWRDFYDLLPDELKKKCWYCEAEDIRSDMPVDHFRPKQGVEGEPEHPGYWWLAFDWENYRCACTFCNSRRTPDETEGGKQNHFPIFNSSDRAYAPEDDRDKENPAFLDPFDCDDYKLLWFDNDGKPMLNPNRITDENQTKVDNSITIYHFHETRIVRERNKVRIKVERAVKELKAAKKEGSIRTIKQIKSKLQKMIRPSEKFSLTAEVYLKNYRSIDEVKDIFNLD